MYLRLMLMVSALSIWRDAWNRRNPTLVDHGTHWSLFSMLTILMYLLVLLPIWLFLYVVHQGNADRMADVIHLDVKLRTIMLSGIGLMLATSGPLSGFARTVMHQFKDQRWTLILLTTASGGFFLYIGYVTTMTTSAIDISRGDNAWLAVFMVAWAWVVGRVCAVPVDRARDSWDFGLLAFTKR